MDSSKKRFKKEYIPLIIAVLVLIVLVLTLFIIVFYKDDKGLIVPDLPKAESVVVGVFDTDNGKYDDSTINSKDTKKVKIDYKVISDYYKKGIILGDTQTMLFDNEFIVYSATSTGNLFVSSIDENGKLNWISQLKETTYNLFRVINIFKIKDDYFVFVDARKEKNNDVIAFKINSKGNIENKTVVFENITNTLEKVVQFDNNFALAFHGPDNIQISTINKEFKLTSNIYNLRDDKNNIFFSRVPSISSMTYSDNKLSLVLLYSGNLDEKMYLLNYDISSKKTKIEKFSELSELDKEYTERIMDFNGAFYTSYNDVLYKFSLDGKLQKNYDYKELVLNPEYVEVVNDEYYESEIIDESIPKTKEIKNSATIEYIKQSEKYIVVKSNTYTNTVYDFFDKDLKLVRRYVFESEELSYDKTDYSITIQPFFKNDKLYRVNTFGVETPSIMISIMG